MDLLNVLSPLWTFLIKYFAIEVTVGGFTFTVGALFIWSSLVLILIMFFRGLAS